MNIVRENFLIQYFIIVHKNIHIDTLVKKYAINF